jgi:hypothetical protein
MSENIIKRTRLNITMTIAIVLILVLVTLIPSAVNADASAGTIKTNWYSAVSPNGGLNEWVYTGVASSTTPMPVNSWANLQTALNAVETYNPNAVDGNEQPYVIYISGDITMGASYTIGTKNIILRKWVGGPQPWNYNNDYPYKNVEGTEPELYDGISDFYITLAQSPYSFTVSNNGAGPAVLSLENVTLKVQDNETVNMTYGIYITNYS